MNIAQPDVPMIHGMGTRPPWVSSLITALPADHAIDGASAIKLRTAFSKAEQRSVPGNEGDDAGGGFN